MINLPKLIPSAAISDGEDMEATFAAMESSVVPLNQSDNGVNSRLRNDSHTIYLILKLIILLTTKKLN
jgi:hypothetical protein